MNNIPECENCGAELQEEFVIRNLRPYDGNTVIWCLECDINEELCDGCHSYICKCDDQDPYE